MAERRYGEREVAEILRAAAERQSVDPAGSTDGGGLTLAEIQRLAGEVGIDERHVAEVAAARAEVVDTGRNTHFWGAPARFDVEVALPGLLDDSSWEDVVSELRKTVGQPGEASTVGLSREWSGHAGVYGMHLRAKPDDEKTRFQLLFNQSDGIVVTWVLVMGGMFISTLVTGVSLSKLGVPTLAIPFAILGLLSTIYLVTRSCLGRWHRKNIRLARDLLRRVEQVVPEEQTTRSKLAALPELPVEESPLRVIGP